MNAPAPALPEANAEIGDAEKARILTGLLMVIFLGAMSQLIVAPILPTLGAEMGNMEHLTWVVSAYLLAAAISTLLFGKLGDIHGRRPILIVALGFFLAGSVLCALAPTLPLLAAARFIQGLGGGAFLALCQAAIAEIIPPRERGRYQGYVVVAFTAANVGGPIVGGLITHHAHWSAIFWLNLPLGLLALAMVDRSLRALPVRRVKRSLDLPGLALLGGAMTALVAALSWGGVCYPWFSNEICALFGLTVAGLAAYVVHARRTKEPFLPLDIFSDRVIAPAALASFFIMMAVVGLSAYMPMYFEIVRGLPTNLASLAQTGLAAGIMIGGLVMGRLLGRLPQPKHLAIPLLGVSLIVLLPLSFAIATLPIPVTLILLAVIGVALGAMMPLTLFSIQNAAERDHLGSVMGTLMLLRSVGGAIGAALYGAILLAEAHAGLHADIHELSAAVLEEAYPFLFLGAAATIMFSIFALAPMEQRALR